MKGIKARHKIFTAYSKNLQYVTNRYEIEIGIGTEKLNLEETPVYICPVCTRAFSKELIDYNFDRNPLTLEDLPPKSVGGNPKILTCKECNSKSGYSLDKAIPESIRTESFLKRIPGSNVDSLVGFNKGKKFRAITKIGEEGQIRFHIRSQENPILKNQIDELKENWNGSTIEFSISFPGKSIYLTSLIRIGLLLSFYYFGNRILFEGNYHRIREHILDKENKKLPHNGVVFLPDSMQFDPGLYLLVSPERYRTYFVIFIIRYKGSTKTIGMPIPGPGKSGWEKYENFQFISSESKVDFIDVTSKEYITNRDMVNAYDYIYENL